MQIEHRPDTAPDKSKTYCLVNPDGSMVDWFGTHAEAVSAMKPTSKARYSYSESYLTPISISFADGDGVWIDALEAKTYHTAQYGEIPITLDKLSNLAASVKDNVRGIEILTDYNHGNDAAKGTKASGTIHDAKVVGNKLQVQIDFTDTAKDEIKAGEWKYFSINWIDQYVHDDGSKHSDVLLGGGLTNRPVAKGLSALPVNFSELYDEKLKVNEPGDTMNELLKKMAQQLGIQFSETEPENTVQEKVFAELTKLATENTELTTKVTALETEVAPLRDLKAATENQKSFAEQFPEQARQMDEDRKFRQESASKTFAETISTKRFSEPVGKKDDSGADVVVVTNKGLSALALDNVRSTHLKFSEGTANVEDFTTTINSILDGGIVDYGENGTAVGAPTDVDATPTGDLKDIRQMFAEKVYAVVAEKEGRSFAEALPEAARRWPKMYDAYMGAK